MTREPDFSKGDGLLPAVVQDYESGTVLMVGYMNEEAYRITVDTGLVTFFSRSRQALWTKGETSGNTLQLKNISVDCDSDALLVSAIPSGPTCHNGTVTCFEGDLPRSMSTLSRLAEVIRARAVDRLAGSYTASLFDAGIDRMAQKVGEEAVEVVIEAKNGDTKRLVSESADLLFHLMVLWESQGVSLGDICAVLEQRAGGSQEKAAE